MFLGGGGGGSNAWVGIDKTGKNNRGDARMIEKAELRKR